MAMMNWWWIFFVVWLTDDRCLALFPAVTIVRDPHHRYFLIRGEQDLNLHRAWVQALLNENVQSWRNQSIVKYIVCCFCMMLASQIRLVFQRLTLREKCPHSELFWFAVSLRIQSECEKMRTRITLNVDTLCEM